MHEKEVLGWMDGGGGKGHDIQVKDLSEKEDSLYK